MRLTIATLSCALALLWSGGAHALSPEPSAKTASEQACEIQKLDAASNYHGCVSRALRKAISKDRELADTDLVRCDRRFNKAFEDAEASGACRTPGGASTLREPVKVFVLETQDRLSQQVIVFEAPNED